ncbi:MAG TPA: ATP-binding protein [Pyrinomonadaceae bacterium]|jgi:PAS domain S-box-containing protein
MRVSRVPRRTSVLRYSLAFLVFATALLFIWPGLFQNLLATRSATEAFMPHQHCYQFVPELVWLHLSSDTLIGLSYVSISLTLAYLVYRARRDIPFHWVFLAFGLFIIACGATHFMEVWTTYTATYWLSGYVKLVTAVASVATALVLPPLVPRTLALVQSAKLVEERYRSLADAMPAIVWTADADGSLDYYNRRWFEYTGLTPEQSLGWGWQPVLHPEDTERCLRRWARCVQTGEKYEIEYRFRRASDATYRWHLGRALPMRDEAGQVVRWFGTSTDIHDQKMIAQENVELLEREQAARRAAEAANSRLEAVQSISEAALLHLSISGLIDEMLTRIRGILHVDTVAILLVEEEGDELVAWAAKGLEEEVERGIRVPPGKGFAGRIFSEQRPIHIEDIDHADVFNPLLREKGLKSLLGVPLVVEGRATGVIHIGTLQPRRFTEEDTRLLQLIAERIALAIDHARLYEVEKRARAEAEEANRLKDEFLTTLSHELRTPLTPVIGWVHMMRNGSLGPRETERGLAIIDKNSHALTRLINDLLDMSAIRSGKMHIDRAPVQVAAVLEEAVETVRSEAMHKGIRVELAPCPRAESMLVSGDRTRLVQVFWNLLSNAVKFSEKGRSVRVRCEADEREVLVHVEDQGIGISPDFLPFIFERFRQADGSKKRAYGGLGLGLALVRSFVEAHGGRVEAGSDGAGLGSRFTVRLPRMRPASLTVVPSGPHAAPGALTKPAAAAEALRVLIIEDAVDTLNMLQLVFETRGYKVTLCQTPTEALRVATSMWFDMIISDIGMPEIDGYELLRRLRQMPHLRNVPAVALTGYASRSDADAAREAGFDAHIAKPIDPDDLAMRIERLLQERAGPRQ